MSLNALCSLFAPPSWEQTPKWLASEFEAQLFFFFAHRASTLLQRTHLFAAHPPLCPLAQCLSQQWTFFGCVEGIEWESHLVPGLLVRTW